MAKLELDSRPALLRKLKRSRMLIKPGLAFGPRKTLNGEPVTPNKVAGVTRSRRPTLTELGNALRGSGLWREWLLRLADREPVRYQALTQAWQTGGDGALRGCLYVSDRPCRKCSCVVRSVRTGECWECRKPVRFNAERKLSDAELCRRDARQQARESAAEVGTYTAGSPQYWLAVADATGIRYWHPVKTRRVLRELDPVELQQYFRNDQPFRALFLHLTENQPLPEWAVVYQ